MSVPLPVLRYEDGVPVYRSERVPAHLGTRRQLRAEGLSVAGLVPAARLHYSPFHGICPLYERNQARPVRPLTPAQRAALAAGRRLAGTALCRRCGTRTRCAREDVAQFGGVLCGQCQPVVWQEHCERQERKHQEMLRDDREEAVAWARGVLVDPRTVLVDLETTGLNQGVDDYVVQVAVVSGAGEVLVDELVDPGVPIPAAASAVHGITDRDVAGRPRFGEVLPRLERALRGRRLVIYNAAFDLGILANELERCRRSDEGGVPAGGVWGAECAMEAYAAWYGDWHPCHRSYTWQPLDGGHTAVSDCRALLRRLKEMAGEFGDSIQGAEFIQGELEMGITK